MGIRLRLSNDANIYNDLCISEELHFLFSDYSKLESILGFSLKPFFEHPQYNELIDIEESFLLAKKNKTVDHFWKDLAKRMLYPPNLTIFKSVLINWITEIEKKNKIREKIEEVLSELLKPFNRDIIEYNEPLLGGKLCTIRKDNFCDKCPEEGRLCLKNGCILDKSIWLWNGHYGVVKLVKELKCCLEVVIEAEENGGNKVFYTFS